VLINFAVNFRFAEWNMALQQTPSLGPIAQVKIGLRCCGVAMLACDGWLPTFAA
jgi:hypothetical protein